MRSRRRPASSTPTTSHTSTGSVFPFAWMGSAALNANESLRREIRRPADEDAVGRCSRLDPRGRIEHVACGRPLSLARPRPEHHERLAGVDAGPDVEVEPLVLRVQLGDSLPDCERSADGTLRIVLVRLRRAEERQNGIAAELLEGAAVPLELAADARVVGRHERSHVFGIEILRACGRADEVDEDRGDDLAFLARRRCGGKRTPAEAAKPELGGIRFATRWADGGLRLGGLAARQLRARCRRSRKRGTCRGSPHRSWGRSAWFRVYEPIRPRSKPRGPRRARSAGLRAR